MGHAGELAPTPSGGPSSVRFCVDSLKASRIGHGVLAAEDSDLVDYLAAKRICLDVCPTSNYLLRVVDDLSMHPLKMFLQRNVACSINSDDPLLFGCNLLSEYECCRKQMDLTDAELATCARNSFIYSCAPARIKEDG